MANAVREKPPYKEDFLETIVNVGWGGEVYVLFQLQAGGRPTLAGTPDIYPIFDDGSPGNQDDPSKNVSATLEVKLAQGASIVYSRQNTTHTQVGISPPIGDMDWTVYYRNYSEAVAVGAYDDPQYRATTVNYYTESFSNITGKTDSITHSETFYEFRPFLALSPADETTYDAYFASGWAYPWHKRKFTVEGDPAGIPILVPTFEAVYLIRPPSIPLDPVQTEALFTITTSGFICETEITVYNRKGLVLDPNNKKYGIFFGPPNGRVYFPFKWQPNSATFTAPPYDVELNYCWDETLSTKGVGKVYPFVLTRDKHLLVPPVNPDDPANKFIRDVIYQLYPKQLGAEGDNWSVFLYTDVLSFEGPFYAAPLSWKNLTITTKPPPIAVDTPV